MLITDLGCMRRRSRIVTYALSLGMIILPATAAANEVNPSRNPATAVAELDPVQVQGERESGSYPENSYLSTHSRSAAKMDIPLLETPQSISVITLEQMRDRGVDNLTEAVDYSPGVYIQNRASQDSIDSLVISIRGFSAQSSTFRDGTQIQAGMPYDSPTEIYGLERIEILRGPASVLYGQGQPGGVINMVTKTPTGRPLYEVGVEYGSYDHRVFKADVSQAITADGDWRYRLTGLFKRADSHIDFVNNDRIYFAPALSWEPRVGTRLTFLANYQLNETKYPWSAFPRRGTKVPGPHGLIPDSRYIGEPSFDRYDSEEYAIGYLFEHEFSDRWTFRQNLRYRDIDYDIQDVFRNYFGAYLQPDFRTINRDRRARYDSSTTLTFDNQLLSRWQHGNFKHQALIGLDYKTLDYNTRDTGFLQPTAPLDLFNPVYGNNPFLAPLRFNTRSTQADQLGLYFQDHIKFDDRWVLTLGGRQDWVQEKSSINGKRDQSELSLRAGLVYLFDNGFAPYVSYAESFTPQYGVNNVTGAAYEPVTGKQYEAGLRYQPPEYDFTASMAVFEITRENELVANPANLLSQIQIGESRSRGFELELLADLNYNLQLIGSYTYQEVEVIEAGGTQINNGNRVTDRPQHLAKMWLDYSFGGPLAGLGIGAGVRYTGSSFADAANTTKHPATLLTDAALRYDLGGARLQLTANNLLDEQEIYCLGSAPDSTCDFGLPRSVIASLTYRWE